MSSMLAEQRRSVILERLQAEGAVRVSRLTGELDASEMTVRRDIDHLAARGLCRKVHGGACLVASAQEPNFATKSATNLAAKRAIGLAAAALVRPGQAVGISAGSTAYWVAVGLAKRPAADQITVVTNSVPAADVLAGSELPQPDELAATRAATGPAQVILTGGVRTPSQALVGTVADAAIAQFRLDWLFLGVHGLDLEAGLTTPNVAEAATHRAFMAVAKATVVTADVSKWGITALAQIAPLKQVSRFVTDKPPPPDTIKALKHLTVDLTIASQP
ncbi:MAG: DeoR/GlpR family DNA-binding transcription regulator [Bifidobacteriaceae bacterium]|nr:DeoR/GlpR family DNA-binding transcription regulator [Bifidobacteriaceae bacterium]